MPARSGNTLLLPGGRIHRLPDRTPKKKKRRKVRRAGPTRRPGPPAGPYRTESSKPSIRAKATPTERRRATRGSSRSAKRARRLVKQDRRRARQTARRASQVEALRAPSMERTIERAKRESRKVARQKIRVARAEQRALKTLRKAARTVPPDPRTAVKAARTRGARLSPAQTKAFKLFHGKEAFEKVEKARYAYISEHEDLGEPEDLTNLITIAIPGAGAAAQLTKAAVKQGAKKVAKEGVEQAAGKTEAAVARTLRAGSGVKAAGRLTRNVGRRARRRPPVKRPARKPREQQFQSVLPGTLPAKVAGSQSLPVVRGHEEAALKNPKKTAKTTARAVPGLVTAPVGLAVGAGTTAGRAGSEALHTAGIPGFRGYSGKQILAPVKGEVDAQLEFARQVAKVVTADDPAFVRKEVEDNLGLLLPIMLGLGAGAAGKKISKGRVREAVRKIAERARRQPIGDFRGKTPRVLEKQGQRKGEAVRTANARLRIRRETAERSKKIRARAGKAAGEEVVRRGVVRRRGRKPGDLKIRGGDVVGFLVRHSIPLDQPSKALAEVKRIGKRIKPLPEGVKLPADKLSTRDVVAFIERNPKILEDRQLRGAVVAYKDQARYARETKGLSPEHSERARYSSVAVDEDIPLPEERFPRNVEGVVRARPTRGKRAKDVLRKEARRDRSRGRAMRRKADAAERKAAIMRRELEVREKANKGNLDMPLADWQLRELKAVKELERRGQIPPGSAPVGGHLQVVTPRRGKTSGRTLPKSHERLRERIDRLDAKAAELREGASRAEDMAKAKHAAAQGFDPALEGEFVQHVQSVLRRQGRPDPEYVPTGKAREAPTYGATGAKLTQFPGKSKFRKGTAEEMGLVEEGLGPLLREGIGRPVSRRESYKAMRGFLADNEFKAGSKSEWTSNEARELFEAGIIDRDNYVLVPRQLYKRTFSPEEWAAHLKLALDEDTGAALKSARHFKIVRRHAADEFFSQMSNAMVSPKLARANQATSFLILGTSPAWAAMQVVAEYAQAAVAQPKLLNPVFVRKAIREYKQMAPEKRQAFDSWVGVTTRTIDRAEDLKLDLKAGDMESAANAYGAMNTTPLGRLVKNIPTSIRRIDQWKGGRIRALATIAKVDKELNGRANRFLRGVGGMHREMGKAMKALEGKPLAKQLEFVAEHPKWAQRYQSYLDDVMGNWSALTKNERVAAQLMIFYPFVRMSLRWTFYAFPKRHPIKAAMLYYLGQQNANELTRLLGGDPSYFQQFGMVPLDLGNGEKKLVDLSRIAPGSNALIEAAGGSIEGPKGVVAARLAQPVLAALGTAIYGVTPLSGKQEENSGWNALAQLLSLSPPGRALDEATVPSGRKRAKGSGQVPVIGNTERQEALDKLSGVLRDAGKPARYARTLIAPPLPKGAGKVRDSAMLGRILRALEKNSSTARKDLSTEYADRIKNARIEGKGKLAKKLMAEGQKRLEGMEATYDEADNLLDAMFEKYEIPYKKEDNLFLEAYGQLYYGTEPDEPTSIGGTTIGGAPIGPGTASGKTKIGGAPTRRGRGKLRRADERTSATTIGGVPIR